MKLNLHHASKVSDQFLKSCLFNLKDKFHQMSNKEYKKFSLKRGKLYNKKFRNNYEQYK